MVQKRSKKYIKNNECTKITKISKKSGKPYSRKIYNYPRKGLVKYLGRKNINVKR